MANASIEISWIRAVGSVAAEIHGRCLRSQLLAIGASTVTLSSALAASEVTESGGSAVARVTNDGTGCFVAVGTTPDPTALVATAATTAARYIGPGGEITLYMNVGDLVAVHA